jgi:hypothetical protein
MDRMVVHQWRDWLLEKVSNDRYELIQKNDLSVQTILAKNAMDAENQCQQIIKKAKEERLDTPLIDKNVGSST